MREDASVVNPIKKFSEGLIEVVKLVESYPSVPLTVDCVIFGFDNNELKVLLIRSDLQIYKGKWSLLGDFANDDEDLDDAACRVLKERTGMDTCILSR